MLNSRIAVTATRNRTISMLSLRSAISHGATMVANRIVTIGPTTRTSTSNGTRIRPVIVRLLIERRTAVTCPPRP